MTSRSRSHRRSWGLFALLLLGFVSWGALAAPITYTFSGSVSGTLGATPFTGAQITITATGDTTNIPDGCVAPIVCNSLSSVTFTINGVGSGTVTDGFLIFVNHSAPGGIGLERCCGTTGGDWIDLDQSSFLTYGLAAPLGPVTGTVTVGTPQGSVATTAGVLSLTSGPVTFQATGGGSSPTPTTTAVTSSLNPSTVGQSVTFTATVTGSSPTGTVQFKDGAANLGGAITLSAGSAAFGTSALTQGTHSITAVYSGDANNAASTSPALVQTVNAAVIPPGVNQPVPTLSEWSLLALAFLLALFAMAEHRRRR